MTRRELLAAGLSAAALGPFARLALAQADRVGTANSYGKDEVTPADVYKKLPPDAPTIAMVIYPGFTELDVMGPYQFLWALMDRRVRIVSKKKGPVVADTGLQIVADTTFAECPKKLDVLFVGGGTEGTLLAMKDPETREFFRDRGSRATYVASACTGSLILGAAGLLKGKKATGHWAARDLLTEFGAMPIDSRVVEDGNVITGAGVSAGLDLGLALLAKLGGEKYAKLCQLFFEYDPQPIFRAGSPSKADPEDVKMSMEMIEPFRTAVRDFAKTLK